MTLISIDPLASHRAGSADANSLTDIKAWRVEMDTASRTQLQVKSELEALGIKPGAISAENALLTISKLDVKQYQKAPRFWLVTATFQSPDRERSSTYDGKRDPDDPDADELQISSDEETFQRPATKNRDGEAILTSSGGQPNPPIMVEDTNRVYTIEGSVAGAGLPAFENGFRRCINSDTFNLVENGTLLRVVGPKQAKVKSVTVSKINYRGTTPFRTFRLQLSILDDDDPDWDEMTAFLDADFKRRPTDAEVASNTYAVLDRVDITLADGTAPKDRVLLDGLGYPLENPNEANAVFLPSKTLYLATFGGNLPGCEVPT